MNFGGTIRLNRIGVCVLIGICILLAFYMNSSGVGNAENSRRTQAKNDNTINLRKLLIAAIDVAEKGGKEVIRARLDNDLQEKIKGKTQEGVIDPVTIADIRSHCVMFYSIKHAFPKIKVISEEKTHSQKDCPDKLTLDQDPRDADLQSLPDETVSADEVTMWIDPLDATKEYTENLLEYVTTMTCVALRGEPIIGVIHKPFSQEPKTWWVWVNKGMSKNFNPSTLQEIGDTKKIIVSRSHAGGVINVSEEAFGKNIEIIHAAGAGFKSLEVASGNVSAYVHTTAIKKWDICAGDAVLRGLGGKMTTLTNELLDYSSDTDPMNKKGLLATLRNHDVYLSKLKRSIL